MRLLDETPVDPEIAAALDAIDATLAGEPVGPEYAELAELALLLRAERAAPPAEFAAELNNRVWRRFGPEPSTAATGGRRRSAGRWWLWTPAAGLAAAVAVAAVIVVGGTNGGSSAGGGVAVNRAGASAPAAPAHRQAWTSAAASTKEAPALASAKSSASPAPTSANSAGQPFSQNLPPVLQPPSNGRRIIQGAQLSLTTNPSRIDTVAQEVFEVVGQVHGIVNSSTVTATGGPSGYAQFQLSIPSGSMPQAMASLSVLQYARVASRTDTTQDVNNQYDGDVAKLASDRAIRASLLKQLANAVTQGQIDSLTIRLHDINATISSDQAALQSLNNQISYSQVNVTINGGQIPTPIAVQHGGGSGFGLGRAAHDAGRVLTVAAGVALIGLAALAPIALLAALGWWIAATVRRRRREHALDLV